VPAALSTGGSLTLNRSSSPVPPCRVRGRAPGQVRLDSLEADEADVQRAPVQLYPAAQHGQGARVEAAGGRLGVIYRDAGAEISVSVRVPIKGTSERDRSPMALSIRSDR
jgi:hypothetical protein